MDADDDSIGGSRSCCNSTISEPERISLLSEESLTGSLENQPHDEYGVADNIQNADHRQETANSHRDGGDGPGANNSAAQAAKAVDIAERTERWNPSTPSRPASLATTTSDELYTGDERRVFLHAGPPPPDYAQAIAQQESGLSGQPVEDGLYDSEDVSADHGEHRVWKFHRASWKKVALFSLGLYGALVTVALLLLAKPFRKITTRSNLYPLDHPLRSNAPQGFHKSTPQCHFNSYSEFESLTWLDPKAFEFIDTVKPSEYEELGNVVISGCIEIRPAPYGQNAPIEVITNIAKTSNWEAEIPSWETSRDDMLHIYSPAKDPGLLPSLGHSDLKRRGSNEYPCLDMWVGIYVKTSLENFTVHTENLNIDIGAFPSFDKEDWSFRVRDHSFIYSKMGNITAKYWNSRVAHFRTQHGSITGRFGLNDALTLDTNEGDIRVKIQHEAPVQNRYYNSAYPSNPRANLTTLSGSGRQSLEMYQDLDQLYFASVMDLGYPYLLNSYHSSQSGSIHLQTGDLWEGMMHATSVDGSIYFTGEELNVLPGFVDDIPVGTKTKHLWAKKGKFDGSIVIEAPRGNTSVCADDHDSCKGGSLVLQSI